MLAQLTDSQEQNKRLIADAFAACHGVLRENELMSKRTTWRVGGPADFHYTPADKNDLATLIKALAGSLEITFVGLGSNLLVRDGGIRGLVINMPKGLTELNAINDSTIYAQAGVTSAKVAKLSVKLGLEGAEFLAGIPGSFGGALAMNAGAFGGQTWDVVTRVECLTESGDLHWHSPDEFKVQYRHVELKQQNVKTSTTPSLQFIAAELSLKHAVSADKDGKRTVRDLLNKRAESQPIQTANAGSVFKNPQGDYAARLLELAGCKAKQIGGAEYSSKHANFIVNLGNATASDIEQLIILGQNKVNDKFGIQLEPEIRFLGEAI